MHGEPKKSTSVAGTALGRFRPETGPSAHCRLQLIVNKPLIVRHGIRDYLFAQEVNSPLLHPRSHLGPGVRCVQEMLPNLQLLVRLVRTRLCKPCDSPSFQPN